MAPLEVAGAAVTLLTPGGYDWRCYPAMRLWLWAALASFTTARGDPKQQQWELQIPRVTIEDLEKNATLQSGLYAYVLTGFFKSKWQASNWTLAYLRKKIPFEWVDYYPENMGDTGKKPYLLKFDEAAERFEKRPSGTPTYMQIRLGLRGWQRLAKDFTPRPLPRVFWDDDEWIWDCMSVDGKPDKPAIHNFFVTQQWKFLLVGQKGTTMFFHKDGTAAATWQAQLVGRKRWTLCPNTESSLLSIGIDTFNPDYSRYPQFAKAYCGQVEVQAGELLYYPAYWWHHTYQLETPSIAYTGALVGVEADRVDLGASKKPHTRFFYDIKAQCGKCWKQGQQERTCDDISQKWPGAAPPILRVICDGYMAGCYERWDEHATALHRASRRQAEL